MTEGKEEPDYYERFQDPTVYRENLYIRNADFSIKLPQPGQEIKFSLTTVTDKSTRAEQFDGVTHGWVCILNGEGTITSQTTGGDEQSVRAYDLVYVRSDTNIEISGDGLLTALVLKVRNEHATSENPVGITVDAFHSDPEKPTLRWAGPWEEELGDTQEHIARVQGTSTTSPRKNPPWQRHDKTIEVYFISDGRTIIQVDRGQGPEKVPMGPGDLLAIMPGVKHAIGNPKLNKTYSGAPFREFVFKIPENLNESVDPADKVDFT